MNDKPTLNFIKEGVVYIHGEFDDSISMLLPEIQVIIKTEKSITFNINSCGGEFKHLTALLNLVTKAKGGGNIVKTIVECYASSCGSLLACSGTVGERSISQYARHLCHYGSVDFFDIKNPKQARRVYKHTLQHFNNIEEIYKTQCERTAKSTDVKKLIQNMDDECFYINANDCIKYGLADKIL